MYYFTRAFIKLDLFSFFPIKYRKLIDDLDYFKGIFFINYFNIIYKLIKI